MLLLPVITVLSGQLLSSAICLRMLAKRHNSRNANYTYIAWSKRRMANVVRRMLVAGRFPSLYYEYRLLNFKLVMVYT